MARDMFSAEYVNKLLHPTVYSMYFFCVISSHLFNTYCEIMYFHHSQCETMSVTGQCQAKLVCDW